MSVFLCVCVFLIMRVAEDAKLLTDEELAKRPVPDSMKQGANTRKLAAGDCVDVADSMGMWLPARVRDIQGDRVLVHYEGWESNWDEWIDLSTEPYRCADFNTLSASATALMLAFADCLITENFQYVYSPHNAVIAFALKPMPAWRYGVVNKVCLMAFSRLILVRRFTVSAFECNTRSPAKAFSAGFTTLPTASRRSVLLRRLTVCTTGGCFFFVHYLRPEPAFVNQLHKRAAATDHSDTRTTSPGERSDSAMVCSSCPFLRRSCSVTAAVADAFAFHYEPHASQTRSRAQRRAFSDGQASQSEQCQCDCCCSLSNRSTQITAHLQLLALCRKQSAQKLLLLRVPKVVCVHRGLCDTVW